MDYAGFSRLSPEAIGRLIAAADAAIATIASVDASGCSFASRGSKLAQ